MVGTFINISGSAISNGGSGTVTLSGTPSIGQVIEATSSSAASWQSTITAPNGITFLKASNAAGNANINVAGTDVSNDLIFGDANNATITYLQGTNEVSLNTANWFVKLIDSGAEVSLGAEVVSFISGIAGSIQQDPPTTDVATHSLTISPQAPYASASTNVTGGNLVISLATPLSGNNESAVVVKRGAHTAAALGPLPSTSGADSALWLGSNITPSASNYSVMSNGTALYINAPASGAIAFAQSGTAAQLVTSTAIYPNSAGGSTLGLSTNEFSNVYTDALTFVSGTTATSASAGTNGDVPAQVVGYITVSINGTNRKIPYYAT